MKKQDLNLTFHSIYEDYPYFSGTMYSLLRSYGLRHVNSPDEADILVFNGGADIATSIYKELPVFRGIPSVRSRRDELEIKLFDKFVGKKFLLGICRGAQLLNCLNGGSLWQHVEQHQTDHPMVDLRTGEVFHVTSTHHQMMRPTDKAEIIGVSNVCPYRMRELVDEVLTPAADIKDGQDIEVVYYPETQSLCIQGHPEYVPGTRFSDWSFDLMLEKLQGQAVKKAS